MVAIPLNTRVGEVRRRWLDHSTPVHLGKQIDISHDRGKMEALAAAHAEKTGHAAIVLCEKNQWATFYCVHETSLPVGAANGHFFGNSSLWGGLMLVTAGRDAALPMTNTFWRNAQHEIDAMRERAPLLRPLKDLSATPREQARTGLAFLGRALPDLALWEWKAAREQGSLSAAVFTGALAFVCLDLVEALPCAVAGVLNLAIAGVRACVPGDRATAVPA